MRRLYPRAHLHKQDFAQPRFLNVTLSDSEGSLQQFQRFFAPLRMTSESPIKY